MEIFQLKVTLVWFSNSHCWHFHWKHEHKKFHKNVGCAEDQEFWWAHETTVVMLRFLMAMCLVSGMCLGYESGQSRWREQVVRFTMPVLGFSQPPIEDLGEAGAQSHCHYRLPHWFFILLISYLTSEQGIIFTDCKSFLLVFSAAVY